ncbi:NAD(P)/FAD-dependent oxidoreductase [Pseudactinotalea sp. Z1732]|uniref:NAD(P)/FAD-dependent oxidoreductase n=1 Tax=Micrococcales TaxID=85006 RepID=UPI003C7B4485
MSATTARSPRKVPRVLILGGGYVGLHAARQIRKRMGRRQVAIAVVDPRPYMTYQPFLPEAAAGSLEPRHVVASHRRLLRGTTILTGRVHSLDHAARRATIEPSRGEAYTVGYDHVVLALGAVARVLPIPGLAETGIGFKQIEEAISLRNHVVTMMDQADSIWDEQARRRMLTFTFVGGGFAGSEAIGEVEDMAREACRYYDSISPDDLRFVLVEGTGRILPEVGADLGRYALEQLRSRNIDVHLNTFLESCVDGHIVLSDGTAFESDTLVWTAGVKANPVLARTDLPLTENGRVRALPTLQVCDADDQVVEGAWTAGDCAAVPDLSAPGITTCAPTAQHAIRQATHLGKNMTHLLAQEPLEDYNHRNLGTVASLGLYKGVAEVLGLKFRGPLAWFMHRTYHMSAMPTVNRKVRIVLDWTMALLFRRDIVALGRLQTPREEFLQAAASVRNAQGS